MRAPTTTAYAAGAEETREIGRRLATFFTRGDVVLLDGELGAGKTTLVQGLGDQLGVRGRVTSPTYIVSRTHRAVSPTSPSLVHVDAYRLEDELDLETIDLGSSLEDSITMIEWGRGKAEDLSEERFEIHIEFAPEDEGRLITLTACGPAAAARLVARPDLLSASPSGGRAGATLEEQSGAITLH